MGEWEGVLVWVGGGEWAVVLLEQGNEPSNAQATLETEKRAYKTIIKHDTTSHEGVRLEWGVDE